MAGSDPKIVFARRWRFWGVKLLRVMTRFAVADGLMLGMG